MVSESELTENECRYLKLVYREQYEKSGKIRTTALAKSLGVRSPTVTEVLQNLAEKNLLRYIKYHGVELTEGGIVEARRLLRKHRILEVFFTSFLGYNPRRACEEASNLDYPATGDLINSICRTYGHPEVCPCGKNIPEDPKCKVNKEWGGDAC